jgi:hypothetical protein
MRALVALLFVACGGSTPALEPVDASVRTQSCSATFSGAFTARDPACAVTATYASSTQTWSLSTNGNIVPGSKETWTGVRVTFDGSPATGTYDASSAVGVVGQLSDLSVSPTPVWIVSPTSGSLHAMVTGLGPFVDLGGGNRLYSTPDGELDATLVDDTDLQSSSVSLKVTF